MKYLVLTKINHKNEYKNSNNITKLGPWCNDSFDEDSNTHQYHWRNAADIKKSAEYIYFLNKKILPILSKKLNNL